MHKLPNVTMSVEEAWIDYNGHMGDFAYAIAFNRAIEAVLTALGVGEDYRNSSECTVYTIENHTSFLQELHLDDEIVIGSQIVDYDEKRIHAIFTMTDKEGATCAYYEVMLMHMRVGEDARPVALPFPRPSLDNLASVVDANIPGRASRSVAIKRLSN